MMRFLAAIMPVVRIADRSIGYSELLLRVENEPCIQAYIREAECSGRIHAIDFCMLHRALVHLRTSGPEVRIGVNLSVRTIERADPVVHALLGVADVSEGRLVVEITETAAPRDVAQIARFSASMRERGVAVAVDDFGSGHMDAGMVARIDPDILKVDVTIVRNLTPIQKRVIDRHQARGRELVVERVESAEDVMVARQIGATLIQGCFVGICAPLGISEEWHRWGFSRGEHARRVG